jgi:hypothetical protein
LMQGFNTVLVDDARLVQVYTNTKQFDRVAGIWQVRLQKDPNNVQNHLGLAAAYFTAGNKAGERRVFFLFQTTSEKNPPRVH